ncbi:MAG TPA: hypothetical protein DD827_09160 [Gammaproteobacteria bacterium]|nr:hypothetical protein [Gammaproteobacteria bacterium]
MNTKCLNKRGPQAGFTLIELVAAMTIMMLTVTIAIPGMLDMVRNNRQSTSLNALSHSFYAARSEAISRAQGISLCPTSNFTSCSGGTTWQSGWMIFTDADRDGVVDSGVDSVLKVFNQLGGATTVTASNRVTYSAIGMVQAGSGAMTLCDQRGVNSARGLRLATTGFVDYLQDTDGDKIVDDGAGSPTNVSCS